MNSDFLEHPAHPWRQVRPLHGPPDLRLNHQSPAQPLVKRLPEHSRVSVTEDSGVENRAHRRGQRIALLTDDFQRLEHCLVKNQHRWLTELTDRLEELRNEFNKAMLDFVAGYSPLRESALAEWREAARNLNGSAENLIATIEQSFPPAGEITKRFAFETRLFQIAATDSIRLEVAEGMEQLEVANDRRRIAEDASRRLQADLNGFIRESVAAMREATARLATEVLATIDGSENGVHQRTLNRLTTFIDSFKSLNFAGDQQLEATLEKFRRDLLTRSAEDYRNDKGTMASLTEGLTRLRENAVQLARSDAREVLSRFGQMGARKLAAVS